MRRLLVAVSVVQLAGLVGCRARPVPKGDVVQTAAPDDGVAPQVASVGSLAEARWKSPPQEVLDVMHAAQLPWRWMAPSGQTMVLADPVQYPPIAELARPMHELAGMRVDPRTGGFHGSHGGTNPRLVSVQTGEVTTMALPQGAEVQDVAWTVDGRRFALTVRAQDDIGLWVGDISGAVARIEGVLLNPLLDAPVRWRPDQRTLLIRRVPERAGPPPEPAAPLGPSTFEGNNAASRSTYEARNLLKSAHDDALFTYFATCELAIVDPESGGVETFAKPDIYASAEPSPDGAYVLIDRLQQPWSHEVPWWRFASQTEVWRSSGTRVASVATVPLADQVPAMGVPKGPRGISWRATAPHTLVWVEALDGGDPMREVPHRDRLMALEAPYTQQPRELFRAEHRIVDWSWGAEGGTLMLTQRERIRRWQYAWLLDVDAGSAQPWFDLNESDAYASPGRPVFRPLPSGHMVMRQAGNAVFFAGAGATKQGDRPFLDLRELGSATSTRLFRGDADRLEYFVAFAGEDDTFVMRTESAVDVPNYVRTTLGARIDAKPGEATRTRTSVPITQFEDPTPQLRAIKKRLVTYTRADGVPLSFQLHLPPGYQDGQRVPTVLYAYPLEYSDGATAGQVRGSTQRFSRFWGASHLYFLLQGYAVLDRTAMPMVGDPETTYDTFVPQLVADAEAAVAKAVEIGVADPARIGVIGHSHGGLMVANLLAHTDLFAAGVARSGSYNKTVQPFGFQSERRSLFEAREAYIQVSPTFFADQVNEPVLVIHGAADSNPGTRTAQSEVFYEAVRGSGGTARLVLLPHEDHGYRAKESIEHVLWEQLEWFDRYVKRRDVPEAKK